jgi:hypothetical protein
MHDVHLLERTDVCLIESEGHYLKVIRDMRTTAVFSCDKDGKITDAGFRWKKSHLTYEMNFVSFRRIICKLKAKAKITTYSEFNKYFGGMFQLNCYMVELPDDLKVYDDDTECCIEYCSYENLEQELRDYPDKDAILAYYASVCKEFDITVERYKVNETGTC